MIELPFGVPACISSDEFARFQKLLFEIAGIYLPETKKALLIGRLIKRCGQLGLSCFGDYFRYITDPPNPVEQQFMVDRLTTNETYFFREPEHFDFLRQQALRHRLGTFRVWSAAASSGEEAYSIAMVLADALGCGPWEVLGTDISQRMLARAASGHYALVRIDGIPVYLLKRYCLRGTEDQAGTLLINRKLRQRVRFAYHNLMEPAAGLGQFDIIFLRNVLIYFNPESKRRVVANLLPALGRDGYLVIGHSESLTGLAPELRCVAPTIYRWRTS